MLCLFFYCTILAFVCYVGHIITLVCQYDARRCCSGGVSLTEQRNFFVFFVMEYDGVSSNKCSTIGAIHSGLGKLIYMIMFFLSWCLWANVRSLKALYLLLPCNTMVFSALITIEKPLFSCSGKFPNLNIRNLLKIRNLFVILPTIVLKLCEPRTKLRFTTLRLVDTQSLHPESALIKDSGNVSGFF